jgi:hypothetical protein
MSLMRSTKSPIVSTAPVRLLSIPFAAAVTLLPVLFSAVPTLSASAENLAEVTLTHPINILPGKSDGVSMVLKSWEHSSDYNGHFLIKLYSLVDKPPQASGFYEQVLVFDHGKQKELVDRDGPDCSTSQIAIFRVPSTPGHRLVVVTADRVERNDGQIPIQAEPRPQKLQYFELRNNTSEMPDRSSVWLEATRESVTKQMLCGSKDVHKAMTDFIKQ